MASQALVSHASETIGGQAVVASALEGSVITDGRHCLTHGSSLSNWIVEVITMTYKKAQKLLPGGISCHFNKGCVYNLGCF